MDKRTRFSIRTLSVVGAALASMPAAWAQQDPCACGPEDGCAGTFLVTSNFYEGQPPSPEAGFTVPIQKFDPALGVLKRVRYTATVVLVSASESFENLNTTSSCTLTGILFQLENHVQSPAGVTPNELFPGNTALFDCSVSPLNVTLQPNGQAGDSFTAVCSPPQPPAEVSGVVDICSDEQQLNVFVGNGNVLFPFHTLAAQNQTSNCSLLDPLFLSEIRVTIQVRYDYCPPEPVLLDRKVTKPAGSTAPIIIPIFQGSDPGEGCEFDQSTAQITNQPDFGTLSPGPGNNVTYTPGGNFPPEGEDVFCFSIETTCGCIADACVEINELPVEDCVERHRRNCGSLLLYPEYDNRPGRNTVYTITYGCCDDLASDIWVEFIYIDATDDCTEENRTVKLTPCDTFTFLTRNHAPPAQQGYMYAFAKSGPNPVGPGSGTIPIVANRLIGSSFQVNGIEIHKLSHRFLSYTMNAVSFKAPGVEGTSTDHDADFVRDLDGEEYEEAPDQILIPSFLGQDPTDAGISSDLILIALSGGSEFTTRVLFWIYDDMEHGQSATHVFDCWQKIRLRDISGAFLESNLEALDDPAEIAGAPQREAGWFRIDGLTASSGFETINDPAIYAVLIQQHFYEIFAGAELPFELCSQDNGDLLPTNVFGDPRPGFPSGQDGDNQ